MKGDSDAMKTLHHAGTSLGFVGLSLIFAVACSGSTSNRNSNGTGGKSNGGASNGGASNGGRGGANNGGTGNVTVPTACATVDTVDVANPFIADFECIPGHDNQSFSWFPTTYQDWTHGGYWYYDSAAQYDSSYQAWSCMPTARGGMAQPGYNSDNAGYVEAFVPSTSWGAGFGIWMGGGSSTDTVVSCVDATAFTGIKFVIKGVNTGSNPAGAYRVEFKTFDTTSASPTAAAATCADTTPPAVPKAGGCTAAKCDPYTWTGTLPADWTPVTILWTDLQTPTTGVTTPFNPAKLTGINIAMDTSVHGGTAQLYIDNIEFVGGGPTVFPRNCASYGGATGAGGAPDFTTWQKSCASDATVGALAACNGTPSAGGSGGSGGG